jgi:hypothetical protein
MEADGERDVRANNNVNFKETRNTSVLTYTGIFAVVFLQKRGSQSQKPRNQKHK